MFYIGFTSAMQTDSEGRPQAAGELTLGDDSARFVADLHVFTMAQYEAQWREAVARLAGGHTSSALITSYRGSGLSPHSMWPMWRAGTTVFIHERLVLDDTIGNEDVAEQFYARVGPRRTTSDDGSPISEWALPLSQMLAFVLD
jgi:hypothetical protein